jgi:hypothetical protein
MPKTTPKAKLNFGLIVVVVVVLALCAYFLIPSKEQFRRQRVFARGRRPAREQEIYGVRGLNWGEQCGGRGGSCKNEAGCVDAPWERVACPGYTACTRKNEWHWQCDPNANAPAPSAERSGGPNLDWGDQCGGKGGNCHIIGKCDDSPWPNKQCPKNAKCNRRNEWHWQCE